MAARSEVEVLISADSKQVEKAFDRVGAGAKDMAKDLNRAEDDAKSFGKAMDRAAEATDNSEKGFMGTADLLDGLGGAFGLPTEGVTNMARSFGDLSGGFATVGPMIAGFGSSLAALLVPLLPIIAGVAAFAAGLVLLYKNSETFRDIVSSAFDAVKKVVGPIIDGIGKAVSWVTGLFKGHKEEVEDTGDAYKTMAADLNASLNAQRQAWVTWKDKVTESINGIMNPLQNARSQSKVGFDEINQNLVDNVKFFDGWINNLTTLTNRGFGALASKLFELGPTAEKAVGEAVTKTDGQLRTMTARFGLAGVESEKAFYQPFLTNESLKAFGDAGVQFGTQFKKGFDSGLTGPISVPLNRLGPSVPHLADGGIVTRPTLALVGEAGPEAVVPLGQAGGVAGGAPIVVNVYGTVVTENQLIDAVHEGLLRKQHVTALGIAS